MRDDYTIVNLYKATDIIDFLLFSTMTVFKRCHITGYGTSCAPNRKACLAGGLYGNDGCVRFPAR